MSSSSGSSWSSGNSSSSGISSGVSSSAMCVSLIFVLNWFAVLVLAWVGVIFPNANLPLLVDPSPYIGGGILIMSGFVYVLRKIVL